MGTNQKPVLRPLQSEGTIDSQSTLESSGSMPERLRLISAERQRANHGAKPLVTLERLPAFGRRRFQKMTLDTYPANLNLYNQFRKALEQENEIALLPEVEARLVQFEDADLRALYAQAQQRIGNLEVALQEAERAFGAKRSSTTLYSTGFIRGLTDPQAGLALLHQGLCSAEMESDLEACVRCATGISLLLTRLGQYTSATDWAQWGFRGLEAVQPRLRFSALCALASAHSLGGIAQGIDMLIAEFEENLEDRKASLNSSHG